jgi:large subunit ribosomal protein L13
MKKSISNSLKVTRFTHKDETNRRWFLVNADGQVLGRMASRIARIILGKNNPKFTPNIDSGDFVVVVNAEKVRLTGKRESLKVYKHHSLYPGGQKTRSFRELIRHNPEKVVRDAVWGMLPKNRLGRRLITKLKVYAGEKHPHSAQKPELINI